MDNESEVMVFSGSGSRNLTAKICTHLDVPIREGEVLRFSEGNTFVRVHENVRGRDVYLVQSTAFPVNDNFMELLFWVDAFKRASAEKVTTALEIILSDTNVKAVLFNVFGGITRCDLVAKGILEALDHVKTDIPMVVRLVGTNAAEGRQLLKDAEMETADTLAEAAQMAVAAAKG